MVTRVYRYTSERLNVCFWQEIDGKSLLLMQRNDVLTGLSIRLGPALKIYERHVKVLQRTHFQEDEGFCWYTHTHTRVIYEAIVQDKATRMNFYQTIFTSPRTNVFIKNMFRTSEHFSLPSHASHTFFFSNFCWKYTEKEAWRDFATKKIKKSLKSHFFGSVELIQLWWSHCLWPLTLNSFHQVDLFLQIFFSPLEGRTSFLSDLKPNKGWMFSTAHINILLKMSSNVKKPVWLQFETSILIGCLFLTQWHWFPRLPSAMNCILFSLTF